MGCDGLKSRGPWLNSVEICVTLTLDCRTQKVAVLQCMTDGSKRKNGSRKDKLHKLTLEREADTPTNMLLGLDVEELLTTPI